MSKIKMKTHSGAKKRFKMTGGKNKKFKRHQMNKRHILTKKSPKRKLHLRGTKMVGFELPIFNAIARMLKLK